VDSLNAERNVLNSLKQLCVSGRISLTYNHADPSLPSIFSLPDWRFVEVTNRVFQDMKKLITGTEDGQTYEVLIPSHLNFLTDAIINLRFGGDIGHAERIMKYVRDTYGTSDKKWTLSPEEFVLNELTNMSESGGPRAYLVGGLINGMIQQAYLAGMMGYREEFESNMASAGRLWTWHNKSHDTPVRMLLPDLPIIEASNAYSIMTSLPAVNASVLWEMLPNDVQLACYDGLLEFMPDRCRADKMSFEKAFPAPPGIENYRKAEQARQEALRAQEQLKAGGGQASPTPR
jgi:hypothetical protein